MSKCSILILSLIGIVFLPTRSASQSDDPSTGRADWEKCLDQPGEWYASAEAVRIAENVLLYQRTSGGWPKNVELVKPVTPEQREHLDQMRDEIGATIDNGATHSQIRYLARVAAKTGSERYASAVQRGLEYLLAAQYKNGGWPQYYPMMQGYYTHITFNDDAMASVLDLFFDIVHGKIEGQCVSEGMKQRLRVSIQKGIECILACQYRRGDTLTAWCAQHDEKTFVPAKARAYELPSLSGKESVGIVEFLMRIKKPEPQIVDAFQSAVRWFDRARVRGIRETVVRDSAAPRGWNKIVVADMTAPDLWGRFYEKDDDEVFFCDRDGITRYDMSELSYERRNHYGWLGDWPMNLLRTKYPKWQQRWAPNENVLEPARKGSK